MTAPTTTTTGLNGRCFPCAVGSCGKCEGCDHDHRLPSRPMDVEREGGRDD